MTEDQKTHTLRQNPGMSIRMLADYMAASEQAKRSILTKCKFAPKAAIIQHRDAQESISDRLSRAGARDEDIEIRIETLRSGLQATPFEVEVAEHNADYLDRFLQNPASVPLKAQEIFKGDRLQALMVEGVSISCTPHIVLKRVNRRNTPKIGLGFFRYSKGRSLPKETADWQNAIAFGYLKTKLEQGLADTDPERDLCVVLDIWGGRTHAAPGNSVYRFNEVKAVCAGIGQRWGQIPPPLNAIF